MMQVNRGGERGLSGLSKRDREKLEKRLAKFAGAANHNTRGRLDRDAPLRDMPPELAGTRHYGFGRHRVYYSGSHLACSYTMFHVKLYKKDDVDPEHSPRFQRRLTTDRLTGGERTLRLGDGGEEPKKRPAP